MKYVVVAYSDVFINCIGVFDSAATAYGEAMMYLSNNAEKGNVITPLCALEGETGYSMILRKPLGDKIETVYILFAESGDGEAQTDASYREVQNETSHV